MAHKPTYDELAHRVKTLELQIAGAGSIASVKPGPNFQIFSEQSPNMIFINKGGRVIYANRKCAQIMGYSREELCTPAFDFMALIVPESVDLIKANFLRHLQGEDIDPCEYTLVNKHGEKIEAIITTKLIDYEGEPAILGIVTDITERKRAEEELQYRLKFQHLITQVSSRFINLDPAQIDDEITGTLRQIGEFVAADRSYVFQL
jgi:PAS domain S-box-containing protein